MELIKQVVSFELSVRLKKLNIKQNSLFYWVIGDCICEGETIEKCDLFYQPPPGADEYISAFTVAELGEMLPANCSTFKITDGRSGMKVIGFGGRIAENGHILELLNSNSEANSRALMLIYLIEQGHIKP